MAATRDHGGALALARIVTDASLVARFGRWKNVDSINHYLRTKIAAITLETEAKKRGVHWGGGTDGRGAGGAATAVATDGADHTHDIDTIVARLALGRRRRRRQRRRERRRQRRSAPRGAGHPSAARRR